MSDKCKVCDLTVVTRKAKIQCSSCSLFVHGSCINMTSDDIDFIVSQNEIWRCESCQIEHRSSLRAESSVEGEHVTNSDIMRALKQIEKDLGTSVEACHARIGDLVTTIESQSKLLKEYENKFDLIFQENNQLKSKVKILEERLEDMEQYSRINCLEVNGIPEDKSSSPIDMVKKVGTALGVEIKDEVVDACHYLGAKRDGGSRGIIVKFVRRSVKEELLKKRKVKRNLNTNDIGVTQTASSVIYINESLSPSRRKVLNAARAFRKDYGYTYVWVSNGKVFLRKNQGDKAIVVTSLEQLTTLEQREAASLDTSS